MISICNYSYVPICQAVNIEVAAVVDVEEDVANGVCKPEGLGPLPLPVVHDVETCHYIEEGFWSGEKGVEDQSWDQQKTAKMQKYEWV